MPETTNAQVDAIDECQPVPHRAIPFAADTQLPQPSRASNQPGAQGISGSHVSAADPDRIARDVHPAGNWRVKAIELQILSPKPTESSVRPANSAARPRAAELRQTERSGVFRHKFRQTEHMSQRNSGEVPALRRKMNSIEQQRLSLRFDAHLPMTFPELIRLLRA